MRRGRRAPAPGQGPFSAMVDGRDGKHRQRPQWVRGERCAGKPSGVSSSPVRLAACRRRRGCQAPVSWGGRWECLYLFGVDDLGSRLNSLAGLEGPPPTPDITACFWVAGRLEALLLFPARVEISEILPALVHQLPEGRWGRGGGLLPPGVVGWLDSETKAGREE